MRILKRVFIVFAVAFAIIVAINNIGLTQAALTKTVYPGGFIIAMVLDIDGVVIDEVGVVKTAAGDASLANKLNQGDTITEVDGQKISGCEQIVSLIEGGNGKEITLTLIRNGKEKQIAVTPYIEIDSGLFKLGVYLRDTISGVGTVTYVKENGRFGALGHRIVDSVAGNVPISGGKVFDCEIVGVVKGKRNEPGELRASIKGDPIGEIYSNTDVGVFGKFYDFLRHSDPVLLGNKSDVLPGKAYILATVDGSLQTYEVDIIRALPQSEPMQKGILIRVTDKRLLSISGGIVQGMSGSPILVGGKIVGAVTHVLTNDSTKGYGIYTDWMQSA